MWTSMARSVTKTSVPMARSMSWSRDMTRPRAEKMAVRSLNSVGVEIDALAGDGDFVLSLID